MTALEEARAKADAAVKALQNATTPEERERLEREAAEARHQEVVQSLYASIGKKGK